MKKMLFSIIAMLLVCCPAVFGQAAMTFETSSHDFGKFAEDQPQKFVFNFTNSGNKPLVIHQAITSCGCTVANFTKTPIEPGKKGEISITYNGKGKLYGPFAKTITIRSNAKPTISRLSIKGDMVEPSAPKKD